MRAMLDWRGGNTVLLGEANVLPKDTQRYFGRQGDGIHIMFNFFANQHAFLSLATEDARPLGRALLATARLPDGAQWAHFLRNHDELDLGRLKEADRKKVFDRFGADPDTQLYDRGIRRRLAPMFADRRQLELAYSLLFSLPGAQVIRYGDEIGMGDDLSQPERKAVRTPMQWSSERHAGFSTARRVVQPVISGGPYGYQQINVEAQRRDPNSLLNWMVNLIRLRKECPEIGLGRMSLVRTGHDAVLGLQYEWRGNRLVMLHNFADRPLEVRLRLPGVEHLTNLLQATGDRATRGGSFKLGIEEYGYRWFRCGRGVYGGAPAGAPMP
jgi:maltose alpha-D-glucosyltransferase/alpha-amylase